MWSLLWGCLEFIASMQYADPINLYRPKIVFCPRKIANLHTNYHFTVSFYKSAKGNSVIYIVDILN